MRTGPTPQNLSSWRPVSLDTWHKLYSPVLFAFCTPPVVYNGSMPVVEVKSVRSLGKDRTIREPLQRSRSTVRRIRPILQPMMHVMIDWLKARGGMRSREGSSRTTVFKIPIPPISIFIFIFISPCLSTTNGVGSGRLSPVWLAFDPLHLTLCLSFPLLL